MLIQNPTLLITAAISLSIKPNISNEKQIQVFELITIKSPEAVTPGDIVTHLIIELWKKNKDCASVLSHHSSPISVDPSFITIKEIKVFDNKHNTKADIAEKVKACFVDTINDKTFVRKYKPEDKK